MVLYGDFDEDHLITFMEKIKYKPLRKNSPKKSSSPIKTQASLAENNDIK